MSLLKILRRLSLQMKVTGRWYIIKNCIRILGTHGISCIVDRTALVSLTPKSALETFLQLLTSPETCRRQTPTAFSATALLSVPKWMDHPVKLGT